MKLRILNVLTKTAPTIPQTPHTDLKYPYVPKMAIRTHCEPDTGDLVPGGRTGDGSPSNSILDWLRVLPSLQFEIKNNSDST